MLTHESVKWCNQKTTDTRSDQSAHVRATIGERGGVAHAPFTHIIRLHNIHSTVTVLVALHTASGAYRGGRVNYLNIEIVKWVNLQRT